MQLSKIKSIKKIGKKRVFDIEVPKYQNFVLSNGVLSHNSTDLDTRYGIFLIYVFQAISDAPERIIKQSRYIFIPSTADINTIKETLTNTGMVKNVQVSVNTAIRLKKRLKSVKYSWIIIDRMSSSMDLVVPLNPLSFHLETTK